jgi:putative zinc finger protein
MRDHEIHLSDEDLLMMVDGELSGSRAKQVEEHLADCWDCRARKQSLEQTISNLVVARHAEFDAQVQASAGARALLKANMAQIAAEPAIQQPASVHFFRSSRVRRAVLVAFAAAAVVAFVIGGVLRIRIQNSEVYAEGPLEPRPTLTPGAVRAMGAAEVCRASEDDNKRLLVIPASVKEEVFREYGMSAARPQYFEVDFLITPELGGSNDIRNLWPEPYRAPVWNAHVKDQLEDFLREKVCKGEMDLSTAQHDIAADWILAYKKYFHTDKPL